MADYDAEFPAVHTDNNNDGSWFNTNGPASDPGALAEADKTKSTKAHIAYLHSDIRSPALAKALSAAGAFVQVGGSSERGRGRERNGKSNEGEFRVQEEGLEENKDCGGETAVRRGLMEKNDGKVRCC